MTTSGCVFFNHGCSHLARLLVAIYSLRRHWKDGIAIADTESPDARDILGRMVSEPRLGRLDIIPIRLQGHRRNSCYVTKATLPRQIDGHYFRTLLLDNDTATVGPIDELFDMLTVGSMTVTKFSDWVTTGGIIGGRLRKWLATVECNGLRRPVAEMVSEQLRLPAAAINTGVIGWSKCDETTVAWERLTEAGWRNTFTDELAAQIMLLTYPMKLADEKFNASPIYTKKDWPDVRIWHFHGSKHVARLDSRGMQGHRVWWPIFQECWRMNLAGVQEWAPAGDAALDVHLRRLVS